MARTLAVMQQPTPMSRLEADYGRDFVLTEAALLEALDSCQGFLDRARSTIS